MCVFVFVCICVCLRLSVFVYVCVYVCMYICICIYEYICTSMYVYGRRERGRARNITINTSEEERKFINLYVHAHVRTYIFTYIYPHIHTHRCITRPKGSSVAWSLSVYHSFLVVVCCSVLQCGVSLIPFPFGVSRDQYTERDESADEHGILMPSWRSSSIMMDRHDALYDGGHVHTCMCVYIYDRGLYHVHGSSWCHDGSWWCPLWW